VCRSKNDPRGYYRCAEYNAATRNARRAANRHYRKTLAATVDALGNPDLAEKVRQAPFSSMVALTRAAGLDPVEIAGPTGRVPGSTNNHPLTDETAALVTEIGDATGTGAHLDLSTGEVTADALGSAAHDTARRAIDDYTATADPLPDDPDPHGAHQPHWSPDELSRESNIAMRDSYLETIRGLNPKSGTYEADLSDILDHAAAHDAATGTPEFYGAGGEPIPATLADEVWARAEKVGTKKNMQRDAAVLAEKRNAEALYDQLGDDTLIPRPDPVDLSGVTYREDAAEAFMPPELDPSDVEFRGKLEGLSDDELAAQYAAVTTAAARDYARAELLEHGDGRYADAEVARERGARLADYAAAFSGEVDHRCEAGGDDARHQWGERIEAVAAETGDDPGSEAAITALTSHGHDLLGISTGPRRDIGLSPSVLTDDEWENAGLVGPDDPSGELGGQIDTATADALRRSPAPGFSGRTRDHAAEAAWARDRVGDTTYPSSPADAYDSDIADERGVTAAIESVATTYAKSARPSYDTVADTQEHLARVANALDQEDMTAEADEIRDYLPDTRFTLARAHDEKVGGARLAAIDGAAEAARELRDVAGAGKWRIGDGLPYSSEHLAADAAVAATYGRDLKADLAIDPSSKVGQVSDVVENRARAARAAADVLAAAEAVPGASPGRGRAATAESMRQTAERNENLYLALERETNRDTLVAAGATSTNLGVMTYINAEIVDAEIARRTAHRPSYSPDDSVVYGETSMRDVVESLNDPDDYPGRATFRSDAEADRVAAGHVPASKVEALDLTRRLSTVLSRAPESAAGYPSSVTIAGRDIDSRTAVEGINAKLWADYAAARQQIADGDVAGGWKRATAVLSAASEDNFDRVLGA